MASRSQAGEGSDSDYIQGAADDHENWAQGLTPELFWAHKDELLGADDSMLSQIIVRILAQSGHENTLSSQTIRVAENLYVGNLSDILLGHDFDAIITCNDTPHPPITPAPGHNRPKTLHFRCPKGKLGSRALRTHLPQLPSFLASLPSSPTGKSPTILCACPTGEDLSVGVALSLLCLYLPEEMHIDKIEIHRQLAKIIVAHPGANPSRSTLQSVNAFMMPGANE